MVFVFRLYKEITINFPRFFHQLATEIRRRKVIPVVVTYAVVGWLVLQIAGLTFGPLGIPAWGIRVLIITTIAGFPAVFLLAWLVDFQQKGLMFDLPLWPSEGEISNEQKKSSQLLALVLCLLVIVGSIALVFYLLEKFPKPDAAVTISSVNLPNNTIAVMPFENFGGTADSDYFAGGLAEEILNFLAGIQELNVAARTSSFRFRDKQIDIREIARLLNVKNIVEGSVRREGDRIRVTAQLVDGGEGYNIWSKSYDRKLDDIFAIQQEIASAIVNELKIALSVDSQNRLYETPAENLDAYLFYLQGREKLRSSQDADVMIAAMAFFNRALEIDQNFSRAYAGICEAQLRLYEISNDTTNFDNAEQACEQAKNLNKDLSSEVLIARGRLYRYRGWYEQAMVVLNSVITTSPTAVDAYIELAEVLKEQNKFTEAEIVFLRAVDLKRNYWKAHEALASFYYRSERYSESAQAYEVVTRLTPDVAVGFAGKGAAYWMLGDTQNALLAYQRSLQLKPSRQAYTNIGLLYYYTGQFTEAAKMQKLALDYAPDDHRVWGRLAESYRFIAGKEAESQSAYKRAAELAQNNLKINNESWSTRGVLGVYYVHLGREEEAKNLLELAIEQSQRNPEILYLQALVFLQAGNTEEALVGLEEAVQQEAVYRQFIADDPDLQTLKDNPRFIKLLPVTKVQ
jgi:TolB-like protein/Flp pilus assembly protein TadD